MDLLSHPGEAVTCTQSDISAEGSPEVDVLDRPVEGSSPKVALGGLDFDSLGEDAVVGHVHNQLRRGRGGWIVTPNIDILRAVARDVALLQLASSADLTVADGAPLLWMARLCGRPLPGRVAGASLLWSLSARAARDGRSVFLLGGERGVAERAAERLRRHSPGLRVAGTHSPPFGFDADPLAVEDVRRRLVSVRPDLVFVGLGFPRQERLITRLLPSLPCAWWLGCGAAIPFAAGTLQRAPVWAQSLGLEWAHRLVSEPRRLFRRYLIDDLPFAVRLLAASAVAGWSLRPEPSAPG